MRFAPRRAAPAATNARSSSPNPDSGEPGTVYASREVILAGGTFNSPQLLMLSGIGDPEALRAQDMPVKVPLPGVGRNLQDHVSVTVAYARKEPGPLHAKMRADRIAMELGRAYLRGEGIAADWPGGVMWPPRRG